MSQQPTQHAAIPSPARSEEQFEAPMSRRPPRPDVATAVVTMPLRPVLTQVAPAPDGAKPARAPGRSHPKARAQSAWAAWIAGGPASSGAEFFSSVASWTEGTAAQLLRQPWPALSKRPTSAEVEERLRHHLKVVVHAEPTTYLDGLGLARTSVIEELRSARQKAGRHTKPSDTR
jgi:hypothetical protein